MWDLGCVSGLGLQAAFTDYHRRKASLERLSVPPLALPWSGLRLNSYFFFLTQT